MPMRINLDLNKKDDIVGPDVLFLSKTTRCNEYISTLPVKRLSTVRF